MLQAHWSGHLPQILTSTGIWLTAPVTAGPHPNNPPRDQVSRIAVGEPAAALPATARDSSICAGLPTSGARIWIRATQPDMPMSARPNSATVELSR
jgi:hypothetical protein